MEGRGIRLTREDMLKKLATVKFKFIDPPTEWKDIGFTEREIWVNPSGYGYLCCDEPNAWFKGTASHRDKFESIKKKLECDEFEMEDIEEEVSATLLPDLLETIGYYDDEDGLREVLDGILSLPKEGVKEFYCLNVSDGLFFFDNEEDFRLAYERTDCDYKWEDLDDESLNCWIGRLFPDLERTFRGIIECHDEKHDIYVEINKTIKIKGSIANAAEWIASDTIQDWYQNDFWDAIELYPHPINGRLKFSDIEENIYDFMRKYIIQISSGVNVILKELNEAGETMDSTRVALSTMLLQMIEGRESCEQKYCDVGKVVEKTIDGFVKNGTWHYGFRSKLGIITEKEFWPLANNENDQIVWEKDGIEYEPILWFGDSDIPEEPWMISTSMSEEKLGCWFEVEPWFILESIIEDCDDIFLTWYIAECGLGVPDIESIREKCPIVFDETCTMDEISLKMYEFFKGIKESDS